MPSMNLDILLIDMVFWREGVAHRDDIRKVIHLAKCLFIEDEILKRASIITLTHFNRGISKEGLSPELVLYHGAVQASVTPYKAEYSPYRRSKLWVSWEIQKS